MAGIEDLIGGLAGSGLDVSKLGGMVQPVLDMITSKGGLQNVLSSLQANGLGDQVSSWVGTGANQTLSADEVSSVVSSDTIGQIAQQSGLSTEEVTSNLGSVLPEVVNNLTPAGQVPSAEDLSATIGGLLGGS